MKTSEKKKKRAGQQKEYVARHKMTSIQVPEEAVEKVRAESKRTDKKIYALIRDIINDYFDRVRAK